MLTKLLKHEWKETWRIPALCCAIVILMTLTAVICFTRMSPPDNKADLNAGAFVLMMFYVMTISCISFVITLYVAVRFYKNLYTDEGYLMHTLPVTPRQLLLSKLLVSSLWLFVVSLLVLWAVFMILIFALPVMVLDDINLSFSFLMNYGAEYSNALFGMSLPVFIVFFFFYFIISSISNALIIYGSISLGQMFSKHKVMGSVLCYIGVTILIQTVTSLAMTPYLTKIVITNHSVSIGPGVPEFMGSFMRNTFIFSLFGAIVTGVACYILSEYLMKKQLNLD